MKIARTVWDKGENSVGNLPIVTVPEEPFSPPKDAVYIKFFYNHVPHPDVARLYWGPMSEYNHERRVDLWYKSLETEEYLR